MTGPGEAMACCSTWDANPLIAETPLMRAVLDGYPVAEGHALVIPKRHVEAFSELSPAELVDLGRLVSRAQLASQAHDWTIAVNDGTLAGRTVPHLHVHVIPRRLGDVPDPRGGIRRLILGDNPDPWLFEHSTSQEAS